MNIRPSFHHLVLCLLLMACAMVQAAEPTRLAVISSENSVWSDLLMTRLSNNPAISLVERDDLGKALDEVELKELLGDRKKRSRFGEITGADFLVLLSVVENRARLVVCDTQLGVTLQDQSFGIVEQPQEQIIGVLADSTLKTIQSFAGGVKQVVAAPDFLCRDLTFDFNYLQSDYAEVLRSAYRQIPGTCVVAIEEAKVIATERDIAGMAQKHRVVAVFIEGEYRTTRDLQSGSVSVEIMLRARDASKVLLERKLPSVSTSQAGKEIMSVFTKDLAALNQLGEIKIDETDQYRMLIERANEFSRIGEFLSSTELREAALLLKPEDDEQRMRLIKEYIDYSRNPYEPSAVTMDIKTDLNNPVWVKISEQVTSNWRRSLHHCEYLVLNHRIGQQEAAVLSDSAIWGSNRVAGHVPSVDCEAIKKDYLTRVFMRVFDLEPATKETSAKMRKLGLGYGYSEFPIHNSILACALSRSDGKRLQAEDLDFIADLLIRQLPDPSPLSSVLLDFIGNGAYQKTSRQDSPDTFTPADFEKFLGLLLASDRPLVSLYGRYGKLRLRWSHGEKTTALLQDVNDITSAAVTLSSDQRRDSFFLDKLRYWARQLEGELNSEPAYTTPTPIQKNASSDSKSKSRISLKPIDLRLTNTKYKGKLVNKDMEWQSPNGWSGLHEYRPITTGLDAMWTYGAVFFMKRSGELTQVLADKQLCVADVDFDGRYVWIASRHSWGLSVLDRDDRN